jgi:hypothetical protein
VRDRIRPAVKQFVRLSRQHPYKRIDQKPVAGSDPPNKFATEASFGFGMRTAHAHTRLKILSNLEERSTVD